MKHGTRAREQPIPNHERVIGLLRKSPKPMTAYELLDRLRPQGITAPPTIYRALDRLIGQGRAHRLESLNAFVACADPHHGAAALFSICGDCGIVQEFADRTMDSQIAAWARKALLPSNGPCSRFEAGAVDAVRKIERGRVAVHKAASLAAAISFLLVLNGHAARSGHRRPGLWTMTIREIGSTAPPLVSKFCIDRRTEAALATLASNFNSQDCPVLKNHPTADGSSADAVCRRGGAIITSHSEMHVGETAFSIRSDIRTSEPFGRSRKQTILGTAHWLAACPSGMKPGDLVTSTGLRLKLALAPAPAR